MVPAMTASPTADGADLPYRSCVGITLISRAGLVFIGRRRADAGPEHVADGRAWQMPQGGIDVGEDPEAAALRELYEETNVSSASVVRLGEAPEWLSYELPPAVLKQAWKGRYRGQTQKWFAFGFVGSDDEIDVANPGEGAFPSEFDAWRWEPMSGLPDLIVPFKRPVYEGVVDAFVGLTTWNAAT